MKTILTTTKTFLSPLTYITSTCLFFKVGEKEVRCLSIRADMLEYSKNVVIVTNRPITCTQAIIV